MQYATPANGCRDTSPTAAETAIEALAERIAMSRRVLVLTGAGVSTDSGIPDYRDDSGQWKRRQPVQFREFVGSLQTRRRYWARSLIGWERIEGARPNRAHEALAALEKGGHVDCLVTQNVDGLHNKAGSRRVIDLHGRLDVVECLGCRARRPRSTFQNELEALNRDWRNLEADSAPDGDADLEGVSFAGFRVPDCPACGGIWKPGVVFFGEQIPRERNAQARHWMEQADALLVAGSSLMVWSGYRFARAAAERGLPVMAVNLGRTRAEPLLTHRVTARCGEALPRLARLLG